MYGRLYYYAGNNPVRYIDPDGRASIILRVINDSSTNKKYHWANIIGGLMYLRNTKDCGKKDIERSIQSPGA